MTGRPITLLPALVVVLACAGCATKRKVVPIFQTVAEVEEGIRDMQGKQAAASGPKETVPQVLQLYMGKDVNAVFERFGVPHKDFKMPNGNVIYEFLNEGPPKVIASQQGDVYQNVTFETFCKVTIIANKKNEVVKASWAGNMCQ